MKIKINEFETYEFSLPETINIQQFESFSNRIINLKKFISLNNTLNIPNTIYNLNKKLNTTHIKRGPQITKNEKDSKEFYQFFISQTSNNRLKLSQEFLTARGYSHYTNGALYGLAIKIKKKYNLTPTQ